MRPIPSAPGYSADESGTIWRLGRPLKRVPNGNGYLRIKLSIRNKQRDAYIHRLVCEAYHGPCPPGWQCRHLDGVRTNNQPENLAWSDKATNEADKARHGTLTLGERHGRSRLTAEIVLSARRRAIAGERVDLIAADLGIPYRRLLDAVAGRRWKHLPGPIPKLIKGAQRALMERR
jgi:hypothetical protein